MNSGGHNQATFVTTNIEFILICNNYSAMAAVRLFICFIQVKQSKVNKQRQEIIRNACQYGNYNSQRVE